MASQQRPDDLRAQLTVAQLRTRILELETELAQANAALEDARYLAGRLARLLSDKPDLAATARYIAQVLQDTPGAS